LDEEKNTKIIFTPPEQLGLEKENYKETLNVTTK